jgi:hypothetical protein
MAQHVLPLASWSSLSGFRRVVHGRPHDIRIRVAASPQLRATDTQSGGLFHVGQSRRRRGACTVGSQHLSNLLAVDTANRRGKKERDEQRRLILVQNQVTKVLLALDDPKDALAAVQRVQRSIAEFLASRPPVRELALIPPGRLAADRHNPRPQMRFRFASQWNALKRESRPGGQPSRLGIRGSGPHVILSNIGFTPD